MVTSVVLVGAGLAGVSTALLLAERGVDVVVIERAERRDLRLAGLGQVEPGVVEHPQRTLRALGPEAFAELIAFLRGNRAVAQALGVFERTGQVWNALDDREAEALREAATVWSDHGEEVRLLEDPTLPKESRVTLELSGWGRVDPSTVLHRLVERAERAGVHFRFGVEARVLDTEPPCVEAGGERIEGELLVLTAGLHTQELAPRLQGSLTPVREAVIRVPGSVHPPLGRAGQGWTAWSSTDDGVLVTGARWATPHLEVGEHEATPDPRVLQRLDAFAHDRLGLQRPSAEHWAWIATDTRDHLPLVGPLQGQPRVSVATGFGVNPASWAFGAAAALVDGLLEGRTTAPDSLRTRRLVRWIR